jgi:hypothetical protein
MGRYYRKLVSNSCKLHLTRTLTGTDFFGASIQAFAKLGGRFNYSLLCSDTKGVNLFFAHNRLLGADAPNVTEQYVAARYHPPAYGDGFSERRATNNNRAVAELFAYESEALIQSTRGHAPDWGVRSAIEI